MSTRHTLQRGFAAIAAIFLLVVLAALGGFMVTFSNTQQLTSAQDVQGVRAYWAARAGLEWAIIAVPVTPALCPNAASTLVVSAGGIPVPASIDGFAIRVFCAQNSYAEAGVPQRIFQLESRATLGNAVGSIGYIERSVSASLER